MNTHSRTTQSTPCCKVLGSAAPPRSGTRRKVFSSPQARCVRVVRLGVTTPSLFPWRYPGFLSPAPEPVGLPHTEKKIRVRGIQKYTPEKKKRPFGSHANYCKLGRSRYRLIRSLGRDTDAAAASTQARSSTRGDLLYSQMYACPLCRPTW